jgi:glycosyltransferase involved in cell wall biosynthesis
MEPVRVCAITFDWYPHDPLVRRMSDAAIDAGHEVDVICLRQSDEEGYEVFNSTRIYRVPMRRGFGRSFLATLLDWCWFLLLAAVAVTRLHLKRPYDVIHVHNMPDFLVFAAFIPRLFGAKIVLEVQDVSPEMMAARVTGRLRPLVKWLASLQERISTRFANHVITVGWPFEQLLLARGVPPGKITTVLNSADPRLFPASRRPPLHLKEPDSDRPFTVIYHGTLARRTGLDVAIRALALARVDAPHMRLLIHGRGEFVPYLQELAASLGVSDSVGFSESCPLEKVVDFVVRGDVGIIPYRCDGFEELVLPTKAYEYSWMHIPIVASNTVGIRSMFRPESLVLCETENPRSFADALVDLYRHPEKRARLISNAAADYMPYRWENMKLRYCQLLAALQRKRFPTEAASEQL